MLTCDPSDSDILRVVHVVDDPVFVSFVSNVMSLVGLSEETFDPLTFLQRLREDNVGVLLHAHVLGQTDGDVSSQGFVAIITKPRPTSLTL